MVRMALKLWKLTLEPYQSFSEDDAPGLCTVLPHATVTIIHVENGMRIMYDLMMAQHSSLNAKSG